LRKSRPNNPPLPHIHENPLTREPSAGEGDADRSKITHNLKQNSKPSGPQVHRDSVNPLPSCCIPGYSHREPFSPSLPRLTSVFRKSLSSGPCLPFDEGELPFYSGFCVCLIKTNQIPLATTYRKILD
jgi:hypothetical protein